MRDATPSWNLGSRPLSPAAASVDHTVLRTLQGLLVGLPLLLGGNRSWTMAIASPVVLLLLALTLRERRRHGTGPEVPGLAALVGFVALALATIVQLPPAVLRLVAPATARL